MPQSTLLLDDCAHETKRSLRLSHYVAVSDRLSQASAQTQSRVVFSTRSGEALVLSEAAWQALESGSFEWIPEALREQLSATKILVPIDEREFESVLYENTQAIQANETLYQVLQPSAWCPLACDYCGQEHAQVHLSDANERAFLERLRSRLSGGRYRHVRIGWFGAEPLAGLPSLRRVSKAAQQISADFSCGYSSRIITSGTLLTPTVARELESLHRVEEAEITLDGLGAVHDRRRGTKLRTGTFDRIFENLLAVASETMLGLVVRCNVDHENVASVSPLIEELARVGLAGRVRFYVSPVYSWGNDAHTRSLTKDDFAGHELEWLALQLRLGFNPGLIPPRRKIVCMAVQRDAEVLDAYGNSFNCTEVPYVPAYESANGLNLYRITASAGAGAHAEKLRDFNTQLANGEHEMCRTCRMLPVCGGHCPKAWHEGHPPCPPAKHNITGRLNLAFAAAQCRSNDNPTGS